MPDVHSMVYSKVSSKEYNLCGSINEFDGNVWEEGTCDPAWDLSFKDNLLKFKYQKTYMTDYYQCEEINPSKVEKRYLVRKIQDPVYRR